MAVTAWVARRGELALRRPATAPWYRPIRSRRTLVSYLDLLRCISASQVLKVERFQRLSRDRLRPSTIDRIVRHDSCTCWPFKPRSVAPSGSMTPPVVYPTDSLRTSQRSAFLPCKATGLNEEAAPAFTDALLYRLLPYTLITRHATSGSICLSCTETRISFSVRWLIHLPIVPDLAERP